MTKQAIEKRISQLNQESRDLYNQSQWLPESKQDRVDERQNQISAEIKELEGKLVTA
jgi:hypothetical protein